MSNSKHTPGPWKLVDATYGRVFVESPDLTRIVGFGPRGNWDSVDEANANLIAAAPELLEACKSALSILRQLDDLSGTRTELLVAIAKVEGR